MEPTERELTAIQGSDAKPCCKDPANLERTQPRPDLAVNTCRACGCRHFRATSTGLQLRLTEPVHA
jgi:hypothetical protein